MRLLDRLADLYPESNIPRVYRGLAYEAWGHDPEAEDCFSEAVPLSNDRSEIIAWSAEDHQLRERLERFGRRRLKKAESLKVETDPVHSARQATGDLQYVLADLALSIAQEIRTAGAERRSGAEQNGPPTEARTPAPEILPDSESTAFELAQSEQEIRKYESVIRRADQAIPIVADRNVDGPAAAYQKERSLYKWRQLRSRALVKWAEELRAENSRDALERALQSIVRAEQDLQVCSQFAQTQGNNLLDRHSLEKIRVVALMTRVEINLDQGRLRDARSHLNRARRSLQKYDDLARTADRRDDIDEKYKRFNEIDRRVRQEEAKTASGDSTEPPRARAGE